MSTAPFRFALLYAALLAAGLCGAVPASAQEQPKENKSADPVSRVYDVQFLTQQVAGEWTMAMRGDVGPDFVGLGTPYDEPAALISADEIVNVIRANFFEDTWEDSRHSLRLDSGRLYVTNRADVHEMIRRYLAVLRARRSLQVRLEASWVELPATALDALEAAAAPDSGGVILSAAQAAQIETLLEKPSEAALVRRFVLRAFPGQRATLSEIDTLPYVGDYDVEIAEDSVVCDPTPRVLDVGGAIAFRPRLEFGETRVTLDLEFDEQGLADALTTFDTQVSPMGLLQLPHLRHATVRETLTMPVGATALAAILPSAPGAGPDRVRVLLVRPTLLRPLPTPTELPESEERRQARMFDVGFLTTGAIDYPGIRNAVGAGYYEDGGAVSAAFVASEDVAAGITISPEALIELLRENVAPTSWNNARNHVELLSSGQLIVVQTVDVLDQIQAYLATLAKDRGRVIRVDLLAVELHGSLAGAAGRKALPAEGEAVTPEAFAALVGAGRKGADVRILGQASVAGFNQQRVHVRHSGTRYLLEDYDVEIATRAACSDPIVRALVDGIQLDVTPTLVGDDAGVQLELRPMVARLRGPVIELDTRATHGGVMHQFQMEHCSPVLPLVVREGQWTVAAVTTTSSGDASLVLLTRARVSRVP